ncbi:hypothetical protein DV738_g4429, partial [Chaetothyriales sp. CBS 135597]
MSGRLDQSLDSIIESQKKAKKESHRRRKVGVKAKAPVGGVKKTVKPAKPAVKAAAAASQSQSSKIVVSGLPFDVNEAQIKEYFIKTVGPVKKVTVQYNQNGQSRGIADVIFSKPGLAAKAAKDQNGMLIEVVVDARNVPEPAKQSKLADRITSASVDADLNQELFEYTSGRWLYNEPLRLAERKLVFNVDELKRIAAECLRKPLSEVKECFKLAEGGFNRVFQITMKDGSEVIARLPYPSTQPHRLAMASEVATLDLVRAAGVPVPKVLSYSTDAAQNSVGAEFMIMEKAPGRPIGDSWFDLTEDQRLKVISEVVQAEVKLSKIDLPAYGCVYYEHDLPADTRRILITPTSDSRRLCVGPHTSRRWWYKERGSLDIHRGPHSSPLDLLLGVATKELSWLKAFGRPRLPFERTYRECMGYKKSQPEEHIESLEKYVKVAPYLVPTEARFHRPILRHPDLQPNNIFVSENLDIVGIIDWQHGSVLPQFLAAGIPDYIQNYHDEESLSGVPPKLPEDLDRMDDEQRAEALERYRRRHLHFFYLAFTQRFNPAHFEVLARRTDILTRKLFDHAGTPWEGNNIPLKADLIHVSKMWRELIEDNGHATKATTPPLCPISFAESDVRYTIDMLQEQEETDTQLESVRNAIRINTEGWTPKEEYDGAVERETLIKGKYLEYLDTDEERKMALEHWPFDDFDEDE